MIKIMLGVLAAASLVLASAPLARAQDYPKGPINLVIPLAPGDAVDVASRAMSDELSRQLKVPVLVVNRPGAGAALATDSVVKARKDGYTILLTINGALTFRRVLDPATASYDPAKDLVGLGLAMRTPSIIAVRSDAPFRNFREMVEYSKQNPGKVRIATPGIGSAGDFNVAIINSLTGAGITAVPFTGASPGIAALRGGHVEGIALALGVVSPHLKSGAMRGIALSSKFPEFPDIPTMADLGQRQNLLGVSVGFFAPAGVPDEVTKVLRPVIERVVKDPAIAAKLFPLGIIQEYLPADAFLAEMQEEYKTVEAMAKKLGLVK